MAAEPEKVLQHYSNAVWKVNDLGGKLRTKGPYLSIDVSILFQINHLGFPNIDLL